MYGIEADYRFERRIPPVVNDPTRRRAALSAARSVFGEKALTSFPPSTAGDDFAFFALESPGCYVWLGNGPAVDGALHHNSAYDFNDAAIGPGAAFWTALVEQELKAEERQTSPGPGFRAACRSLRRRCRDPSGAARHCRRASPRSRP